MTDVIKMVPLSNMGITISPRSLQSFKKVCDERAIKWEYEPPGSYILSLTNKSNLDGLYADVRNSLVSNHKRDARFDLLEAELGTLDFPEKS